MTHAHRVQPRVGSANSPEFESSERERGKLAERVGFEPSRDEQSESRDALDSRPSRQ